MKAVLKFLAFCVLVVIGATMIGAGMTPHQRLTRSRVFAAPADRVWSALLSIRQLPYDRSDLRLVDQGTATRPPDSIEVVGTPVTISIETFRPPRELVVKTTDPSIPYGGTWTFVLAPDGNDLTKLTVVEEAEVRGRLVRFCVRAFGMDDMLVEGIFRAVKRNLVETPRG
jgi:hypothetical protein